MRIIKKKIINTNPSLLNGYSLKLDQIFKKDNNFISAGNLSLKLCMNRKFHSRIFSHSNSCYSKCNINQLNSNLLNSYANYDYNNNLYNTNLNSKLRLYTTLTMESRSKIQLKGKKSYSVVIVDVETSGRSHIDDHLLEIAAIKLKDGVTVGQFGSLIRQDITIPEELIQVHGITDKMMSKGIELDVALKMLNMFIDDGSILIAHNAKFDTKFLEVGYQKIGHNIPNNMQYLCTLNLSRRLLNAESNTLSGIATHLGIALPQSTTYHRAMTDTRCTALIWKHLYQTAGEMLGFYPELDFFIEISKLTKQQIPKFITKYKKMKGFIHEDIYLEDSNEESDTTNEEKLTNYYYEQKKRPKNDPNAEIPYLSTDYRFSTKHLEEDPNDTWKSV